MNNVLFENSARKRLLEHLKKMKIPTFVYSEIFEQQIFWSERMCEERIGWHREQWLDYYKYMEV